MDPREPDEHASLLPNGHGHGPSSSPVSDPHLSHERIGPLLYTSHFLSTWNSRMFEFGAILFLTSIFTGTLLPTSSYALVRTCAAILGSPAVGRYIDDNLHRRLRVVRVSIVSQRLAVVLSCMLFGLLFLLKSDKDSIFLLNFPPTGLKKLLHNNKDIISVVSLGFLALLACVEKLGSVMNTVSVERDWVLVIAESTNFELRDLNSQMRRIDLFCKLISPLAIALIDGISTEAAIISCLTLSAFSIGVEYFAIARVYHTVPALQTSSRLSHSTSDAEEIPSPNPTPNPPPTLLSSLAFYTHHPAFLPSLSLSLLYLTVLSFSGQMVTYLSTPLTNTPASTPRFTSPQIGLLRTLAVISEMSATWVSPWLQKRLGAIRAAMWFVNWQVTWLGVGTAIFWTLSTSNVPSLGGDLVDKLSQEDEKMAALALVVAVVMSRVGLWGFDLCVQMVIQEEVAPSHRGTFSSIETSLQNIFELLSYLLTIIFSRPEDFKYPVVVSTCAVFCAAVLYAKFLRGRRGHLVHFSMPGSECLGGGIALKDRGDQGDGREQVEGRSREEREVGV